MTDLRTCRFLSFVAPLLMLASPIAARDLDAAAIARIDAYIAREIRREGMPPGLAIAVVQKDAVLLAKGYGVREIDKAAPVTADTLFELGSVSKLFTVTALARLVDEGRLRWDDTIVSHLPDYAVADPHDTARLTIADLAVHRSGYASFDVSPLTLEQSLKRLRYKTATSPFRLGFAYSNEQYTALGAVVGAASGQPVRAYMQRTLLSPLGMTNTQLDATQVYRVALPPILEKIDIEARPAGIAGLKPGYDVAIGHWRSAGSMDWRAGDYADPAFQFGAAGILSSANDMAQFVRYLLRPAEGGGDALRLTTAARTGLFRPEHIYPAADQPDGIVTRTMGLRVGTVGGKTSYRISGSWGGFNSDLMIVPGEAFGVVVLQNGRDRPQANLYLSQLHAAIEQLVLAELTGETTPDPVETMLADDRIWRAVAAEVDAYRSAPADRPLPRPDIRARYGARFDVFDLPPRGASAPQPLAEFVGDYESPLYGPLRIDVTRGRLKLTATEWEAGRTLSRWDRDAFLYDRRPHPDASVALVSFVRDPAGQIIGARMFDTLFARKGAGK